MRPKDNLREDHGRIMKLFAAWQKMLAQLDRKDHALLEQFETCIDRVDVFVDRCHHGKEDDVLFPAMASSQDPAVANLIADLRAEHQTGRSLLESIKAEFKAFSRPDGLPADVIQLSQEYIDLFRKHIRGENAQLLPLIEKCIPAQDQERIAAQFEQYEQKTMGRDS